MSLKVGKMTMRELSEWFGYQTPDGFARANSKTKEKKLKILAKCARYHWEGKSLYIDEVYIPEFHKAYDKIEQEFPKEWGHIVDNNNQLNKVTKEQRIDTCARVGASIWAKNKDIQVQVKKPTAQDYTRRIKVLWYGHNYLDDHGLKGRSEYVWVDREGMPLKECELEIIRECKRKAYGSISELMADIDDDYHRGFISKEERDSAFGQIETLNSYEVFIGLVVEKLGYYPGKYTKLIDEVYFEKG